MISSFIHQPTVALFAGVMGLLLTLVMLEMYRSHGAGIKGVGIWTVGLILKSVSAFLFAGRGALPDFLSVFVANTLLMTGLLLVGQGLIAFAHRPLRWWPASLALLAWLLPFGWYALVDPDLWRRIVLSMGMVTLTLLWVAWIVLLMRRRTLSFWLVLGSALVIALSSSARLCAALAIHDASFFLFGGSFWQMLYTSAQAVGAMTLALGLILLTHERVQRELEHLATHDVLTGALTRRALLRECEREFARCRRHNRVMSLLVMDLDHFKAINDKYGHLIGDRVLQDFAGHVARILRNDDRLGRFGGEEFIVLLPETSLDEAVAVAERIRTVTLRPQAGIPDCSVSIGVTARRVQGDDDLTSMLRRADEAMYQAKEAGRNCVMPLA